MCEQIARHSKRVKQRVHKLAIPDCISKSDNVIVLSMDILPHLQRMIILRKDVYDNTEPREDKINI